MKNNSILFVLATLCFSGLASASTQTTSVAQPQIIASLTDVSPQIDRIDADEQGMVTVYTRQGQNQAAAIHHHQLTDFSLSELTALARELGTAEVQTRHDAFVCMMMISLPEPSLNVAAFDATASQFSGDPRTVLSSQACNVSEKVFPKDPSVLKDAQTLKTLLLVLGNEFSAE